MDDRARVLWLTGLSGSGKTTIADELRGRLEKDGKRVRIIDGDDIRNTEHRHLGFTREGILENNRLILRRCQSLLPTCDYILVPVISPLACSRAEARQELGSALVEIFVNASLETCIRRDVKGLYKKALDGTISNFIGLDVNSPYEPPENPDVTLRTDEEDVETSVGRVLECLAKAGH